jgi:hypothetical protein
MAEERNDNREMTWRTLLPWTELFRGFSIALDPNKLFLAAIGIFAMAVAWWFLAFLFTLGWASDPPDFKDYAGKVPNEVKDEDRKVALSLQWADYSRERRRWNLMHKATGMGNKGDSVQVFKMEDLVANHKDYTILVNTREALGKKKPEELKSSLTMRSENPSGELIDNYIFVLEQVPADAPLAEKRDKLLETFKAKLGKVKPHSKLNTLPWSEDRGENPFLLATGQSGRPWEAGHFWDWFLGVQLPVVIEPVEKLVLPLVFFFNPDAGGLSALYFFLVFAATVAIWSIVGGAITRIAAVQLARGEKIDFMEAVRFTLKRWASYLMAPVYPLGGVVVLLIFAMIFGLLHMIPFVGDIFVDGIFWPVPLLIGFVMGLAIVGLVVGWPLMAPTISTEGTDSWEALSRSFSYVFQKPFHYLWYALVAISYGAVLIFFVGFIGSFTVYLSKWAVSRTPSVTFAQSRDPVYLFIYAPESFGWRELLLRDKLVDGDPLVVDGKVNPDAYDRYLGNNNKKMIDEKDQLWGYNKFAAGMVAFWLYLAFLLIIGFGYSLFWSMMTIIYFLLRRNVDAAEMDEVYLEEDEHDLAYSGPLTPPAAPPKTDMPASSMVDSPTLRAPSASAAPPPAPANSPPTAAPATTAAEPTEPAKPTTDGNSPPAAQ